jgi:hypothetical protein
MQTLATRKARGAQKRAINLKTAVESGRLAEPIAAPALRGFVRRTVGCAFSKAQERKTQLPQHLLAILPLQLPFLG